MSENHLDAPLTADEFASLEEVAKRLMQRIIPDDHRTKLIQLGFIDQKLGGLAVTDAGTMRLARGK